MKRDLLKKALRNCHGPAKKGYYFGECYSYPSWKDRNAGEAKYECICGKNEEYDTEYSRKEEATEDHEWPKCRADCTLGSKMCGTASSDKEKKKGTCKIEREKYIQKGVYTCQCEGASKQDPLVDENTGTEYCEGECDPQEHSEGILNCGGPEASNPKAEKQPIWRKCRARGAGKGYRCVCEREFVRRRVVDKTGKEYDICAGSCALGRYLCGEVSKFDTDKNGSPWNKLYPPWIVDSPKNPPRLLKYVAAKDRRNNDIIAPPRDMGRCYEIKEGLYADPDIFARQFPEHRLQDGYFCECCQMPKGGP